MSGSRYTHSFSHHDNTSVPIVQAERYTNLPTDPQLASGSIKMKTRDLVNPSSHLVNVVTIHLGTLAGTFRISPSCSLLLPPLNGPSLPSDFSSLFLSILTFSPWPKSKSAFFFFFFWFFIEVKFTQNPISHF